MKKHCDSMKIMFVANPTYYCYKLVESISNINLATFEFCTSKIFSTSNQLKNYSVKNTVRIWTNYLYPFQILKEARKFNPDVIHIQYEYSGIQGIGSPIATMLLPLMLLFCKLLKFKTVITLHAVLSKDEIKENIQSFRIKMPPFLLYNLTRAFTKTVSCLSNLMFVHLNSTMNILHKDYSISLKKLRVIDHGIEIKEPKIDSRIYERDLEKFKGFDTILFFGVLSPRKGIEILLEAFSEITSQKDKLMLIIAGGESLNYKGYAKELLSLNKKLKLEENVIFTGHLSDDEIHSLFKLATIVVFPYKVMPGASSAMGWAMQHRKPVIATRTGYFQECFTDGKEIILVDVDDPQSLSNAISFLLDTENLRKTLSEGLYKRAVLSSWEIVAQKHLNAFVELIN